MDPDENDNHMKAKVSSDGQQIQIQHLLENLLGSKEQHDNKIHAPTISKL